MFVVAAVGMATVVLSLAEMASMYVVFVGAESKEKRVGKLISQGLRRLVGNITGYRNLRLRAYRSS